MGVRARIVLYATDEASARAGAAAAFERIDAIDRAMSDYQPNSELNQLSDTAGTDRWIRLSPDLCDILTLAQQIHHASDGAFDVTIGPLSALWRDARQRTTLPTDTDLADALERTDADALLLNTDSCLARLDTPGMRLDLGAIAKGYGAQAAVDTLHARGLPRCLVDLGGDLVAGDPPPARAGWRIRVGVDQDQQWTIAREAVAASGDLEQSLQIGDQRYSHIIDPRTGQPRTDGIYVTVRARDGAIADALASAISVLATTTPRLDTIDPNADVHIQRRHPASP